MFSKFHGIGLNFKRVLIGLTDGKSYYINVRLGKNEITSNTFTSFDDNCDDYGKTNNE